MSKRTKIKDKSNKKAIEEINKVQYLKILNETLFSFLSLNDIKEDPWTRNRPGVSNSIFSHEENEGGIKLFILSPCRKEHFFVFIEKNTIDSDLVKNIITKLNKYMKLVFDNNNFNLKKEIINFSIDEGICEWISGGNPGEENLKNVLTTLKKNSSLTYEGDKMIKIVAFKNCNEGGKCDVETFLQNKYATPLANSNQTALLVNFSNMKIVEYVNYTHKTNLDILNLPIEYVDICEALIQKEAKIIFILTKEGEILIINDKLLVLKYNNNEWKYVRYNNFNSLLYNLGIEKQEHAQKIFNTIIDTSFLRTGGCFCIINNSETDVQQIKEIIKETDLHYGEVDCDVNSKEGAKHLSILSILTKKGNNKINFYKLNRKLRQELLGLDGATIIKKDGTLIATGAILKLNCQGDGGGRTAASNELSKIGLSVKISEDGEISVFKKEEVIFEM